MCVSQGKKCSLLGNFGELFFLKHLFWDSPFCLITDELKEELFAKIADVCTKSFIQHVWQGANKCLMMMMMMKCFCGMVDQRKAFVFISSWDHCQRSSPSQIPDTPRAGLEPVQNLNSGLVEWSCAVAITTTPRRLYCYYQTSDLSHFKNFSHSGSL